MKRIALILAIISSASIAALAQRSTEVSFSYGAMPAMKNIAAYNDHWHNLSCWGSVNATIDHSFAPGLWIGLGYTYSSASSDTASRGRYGKVVWHGLMANVRYEWFHRGPVILYSHAGVGALVQYYSPSWQDSYNRTALAFQASPLGMQLDFSRHAGAFAEVGYGVQGIIKAGIRVGF